MAPRADRSRGSGFRDGLIQQLNDDISSTSSCSTSSQGGFRQQLIRESEGPPVPYQIEARSGGSLHQTNFRSHLQLGLVTMAGESSELDGTPEAGAGLAFPNTMYVSHR